MSREKNFLQHHIINPLLTKLVQPRWLDIGLVLFSINRQKKIGQYPAILTSNMVNNQYITYSLKTGSLDDAIQEFL